jgi:hypothetical protein
MERGRKRGSREVTRMKKTYGAKSGREYKGIGKLATGYSL